MKYDIDFVITWVDGSDREWQERKRERQIEYGCHVDARDNRYRDMGLLKYWFRAVETYAPWVRKVFLVTNRQIPRGIDGDCDKLEIVYQEDFMPEELIPCFNSCPIELFFHKIPGLSEHFVYFNDDYILNAAVKPEDFFVEGKPVDMLALQPVIANPSNEIMSHMFINNSLLLARHFDKHENMKMQRTKYLHIGYPIKYFVYNFLEQLFPQITGFYTAHKSYPLLKSTYEEVWELEYDALYKSCKYPFRCKENIVFYVMSEWNKLKGNFYPANIEKNFKYFEIGRDNEKLFKCIKDGKVKEVIINDVDLDIDFKAVCKKLEEIYERKLPNKSCFEN